MTSECNWDTYECEQLRAIQAWKDTPPSIVETALGFVFKPIAWIIAGVVPPSAVEGALRAADWLAHQTIFVERIVREAGVASTEDLKRLKLSDLDALADSFHKWAVGY